MPQVIPVTDSQKVKLYEIAARMKSAGLSDLFISAAVTFGSEFAGIQELMEIWDASSDPDYRCLVVADIQDMIDDCREARHAQARYIRFDDLETVAKDIRAFKDGLRKIVDAQGGVSRLAELTGIPQPSLSRFFSSQSMPRRTTLRKIAEALNLSAVEIVTGWVRE